MAITLYVDRMVGGSINVMDSSYRDPSMTRLWWTIPRSGNVQSRDAAYSDVAITGVLTQSSIDSIDGHSSTSVVAVEIGNTVTGIGYAAFSGCSSLASVTIPPSVTGIGSYAFNGCNSLTSVTIPNSVTSIGEWAFAWCSGLTSVTVPNGVTNIGNYAFSGCSDLTSMTINGTPTIAFGAFSDNPNLQEVWMESFQRDYVSIHGVEDWGLGLETASYTTWTVIVHCQDGIIVLNGGEGSSSSGDELPRTTTIWDYVGQYEYLIEGSFNKMDLEHMYGYNMMNWPSVNNITIGTGVTHIEYGSIEGARSLESLTIYGHPDIYSGALYGANNLHEVFMEDFDRFEVANNAPAWGLGFDDLWNPITVIVHCADGILVLNGDSGSSSDGGEEGREHPYTRVIYQNGAMTEDFNIYVYLTYSSLESVLAMGYNQNDITDVEVGTNINELVSGALS